MDVLAIHAASEPRQYPLSLPVSSIGYIACKSEIVRTTFPSMNFSFILKGRGHYLWQKEWLEITAPCVITQWPGIPMNYGPDSNGWAELYFIYQSSSLPELERQRFAKRERPVLELPKDRHAQFLENAQQFLKTWEAQLSSPNVDELDRDCERLLFEAHRGTEPSHQENTHPLISTIRQEIEANLFETIDINELVKKHDLSPTQFRRLWARYHEMPPWQFVLTRRLQKACRLLAETELRISEIAWQCGFQDAQYFSRKFSQHFKQSPRSYRKQFYIH